MPNDDALRALLAARVPEAISALRAYVPDPARVPVRLDANEAPPLLAALNDDERAAYLAAISRVELARYPDARADALRDAIAQRLAVDRDSLVIGCGSDEVIAIVLTTLARAIDGAPPRVLVPKPTFVMYAATAK